ncbi:hypothetical protein A1359_21150 [Methylomonas lenta]|uniref:Uncharacterized protein n=1 Tax=Methylomonas lenta TaxID=980561 RepID=A0A177NQU7_9GAMM|nr:hypothetical protein A1359_21150 [Methylomonas lenta]
MIYLKKNGWKTRKLGVLAVLRLGWRTPLGYAIHAAKTVPIRGNMAARTAARKQIYTSRKCEQYFGKER